VEIFDSEVATGLFFFTQVKATDEPDLGQALAVAFSASTLNYFEAVDEPVLLLRYHASSKTLFGRWFHRIDDRRANTATSTIRFSPESAVNAHTLAAINTEVGLFRTVRNAIVHWPIALNVSSRTTGVLADDVAVACVAAAGSQRYVKFRVAPAIGGSPDAAVEVLEDGVVVHFGVVSVTLHGRPAAVPITDLATDVVCSTGLCLSMAGHHDAGSRLMRETVTHSGAVDAPEFAARMAASLAQGRRVNDVLVMGRKLLSAGRFRDAEAISRLSVLPISDELTSEDRLELGRFFDELAAALASEDAETGAAAYYSSANWHFNTRNYRSALASYDLAAHYEPSYTDRTYYQRERAAALFETRDYEQSAIWYHRSLTGAPDLGTLARFGDSLLHAGRYRDAVNAFEEYAREPLPDEPIWLLKRLAAGNVVRRGGSRQDRRVEEAENLAQEALSSGQSPDVVELAERALTLDALCPSAWWAVGRWHINSGSSLGDSLPALITSVSQQGDAENWAEVFLGCLHAGDSQLAGLVVGAGYLQHSDAFVENVREKLMSVPAEVRSAILRLLLEEVGKLPARHRITIRFPHEHHEFRFGAPS
jgi:tetratricopeptide (TPR) repeat protein